MNIVTRRKFLKIAGAAALAASAVGVLSGCEEEPASSSSRPESAAVAADSDAAFSAQPESTSQQEQPASSVEAEPVWQEKEVEVNPENLGWIGVTLGDLVISADDIAIARSNEETAKGEYVWNGEGVLGIELYIANAGTEAITISSDDFSATLDGEKVNYFKGYAAVYADILRGIFIENDPDPVELPAGERRGESVAFEVPTEEQYVNWKELVIEIHPASIPDEKVIFTLRRGSDFYTPTLSAVKLTRVTG